MKSMETVINIWILLFLFVCGIQDVRKKQINVCTLVIGGCVTGIFLAVGLIVKCVDLWSSLGGILVGIFVLILAFATKEKIGIGDGIVMCICGALIGGMKSLTCVFYGLLLAAVFSMVMLVFRKVKLRSSLPFIPFLLAGIVVGML